MVRSKTRSLIATPCLIPDLCRKVWRGTHTRLVDFPPLQEDICQRSWDIVDEKATPRADRISLSALIEGGMFADK